MRTGRVFVYIGAAGLVLMVLAVVAVVVFLRSLPTGAVPTEDPIVRLNREHADLADNAAELYEEAFAKLSGDSRHVWGESVARECSQPVPEAVVTWLDDNREAMALAAQAAEREHCWFKLTPDPQGARLLPHLARLRELAKLFYARAAIAAREHDVDQLANSIAVMNRMARHVGKDADAISDLVGVACLALAHEFVVDPFGWPELTVEQRTAYAARVAPCFEPLGPFAACLSADRDESLWMFVSAKTPRSGPGFLITPERVAGEMDQQLARFHKLLSLPVSEQSDPNNPVRRAIIADEDADDFSWNIARSLARMVAPSYLRAVDLRHRILATQRGDHTVVELFGYRDRTGEFPAGLEAIGGEFTIDPFSGQPFVYRRTDDGFTLYSRGVDRDDDGGTHNWRFGEQRGRPGQPDPPPDGDFVFWPVQQSQPAPANSDP